MICIVRFLNCSDVFHTRILHNSQGILGSCYKITQRCTDVACSMGSSSSFCLLYFSKVLVDNYPTNVYLTYVNHESEICNINILEDRFHGGESHDSNDRFHGISCRYSSRTRK